MAQKELKTPIGRVHYEDLNPNSLSSDNPTYYVDSGWGGSFLPMAASFHEFAKQTNTHLVVADSHFSDKNASLDGPTYARELTGAAYSLNCLVDETQAKTPVFVGYSKAGPVAAIASMIRREATAGLVLVSPASLIGRDSAAELIVRFSVGALKTTQFPDHPESRVPFKESFANILEYIRVKGLSAFWEIQDMTNVDLSKLLPQIRQRGTPIAVLAARGDIVFPASRIRNVLFHNNGSLVDAYEELDGDHGMFVSRPHQVLNKVVDTSKKLLGNRH